MVNSVSCTTGGEPARKKLPGQGATNTGPGPEPSWGVDQTLGIFSNFCGESMLIHMDNRCSTVNPLLGVDQLLHQFKINSQSQVVWQFLFGSFILGSPAAKFIQSICGDLFGSRSSARYGRYMKIQTIDNHPNLWLDTCMEYSGIMWNIQIIDTPPGKWRARPFPP